ncbi:MAG: T9SS type A sorting domain-containing protein [Bacteroidia bacterium]|nr:T9SS type A sorting domain-containing protein [Bacteroidia bacterium]
MKQILLTAFFTFSLLISLAQDTYYSISDGNWNLAATWAMNSAGTIPANTTPTSNDTVFIRDSVYLTVPKNHIHRGNVFISTTGIFNIFSGAGVSDPYIFAGDSFVVEGRLITSSDFHNQRQFTTGPDGEGILIFGIASVIKIGDDLIVNSQSFTIMNNAFCGDGTSFDDMYFKGTQAKLCGNGKFVIPDALRAWDDNNIEQIPPNAQLFNQICLGFDFYGNVGDCENEINPIFTGGGTFPVELLSFTATSVNDAVQLEWITASESNNHFFTVERSYDGDEYLVVENIPGAGNSDRVLTYNITDRRPGKGTIWYRLKQTDFDGEYTYGSIVTVTLDQDGPQLFLYPNPASDGPFFLELHGLRAEVDMQIRILDVTGKEVYFSHEKAGRNGSFTSQIQPSLSSGLYFVQVKQAGTTLTQKLIF